MKVWISHKILEWEIYHGGGSITDREPINRSYQIWNHAKALIENSSSEFQLSDGITNLKRSYDRRLKLIEKIYKFKDLDKSYKNKGYLEILESYGLARPFIMKNLLTIRNDIEHNDAEPPTRERCLELVDVMWYFLKSTDPIVNYQRSDFELTHFQDSIETQYGCTIRVSYEKTASFRISGWFPKECISYEPLDGYYEFEKEELHNNEKWKLKGRHLDKLDSDMWFIGYMDFEMAKHTELLRSLLSTISD